KWFRALIENSTDGITVLDGDGAVIDITPSGEKILGYSRDELIGRVRADLVHPADIGALQEAFRAIKANPNDVRTVAHRHLRRDGSYRWLECSYKNLLNEPYLNAIVLNYRDITEKKQADLQLRRSEERYRKAQSIGRMGHWELDIENDILTWSDEIYRIFDVDKSDFGNCYEAFRKCVHPDDVQQLVQSREHTLRGQGKFDFVYRIVCRHGKIKYVHELADTVFNKDGKPRSVTGTVQDITEQIVSKNEIINERNLSDCIINSLPAVFCMFTREGEMIRWNVNLETVTSYSREEIGKMRPYDLFDMEERALVAEMADGVFRNGENQVQANLLTRNGEKIPYFLTGRAIHYEGRHCLLGVGIDFSDRIRAQRKIKETSRQLRQLAAHLQHIREEERTGIARDIHDDLGQQLTAVQISLYRVAKRATGNEPLQRDIEMVNAMTSGAIESIRKIAMQLRPGILEDMGLLEAMKWQIEEFENRFSIPVAADFSGVPDGVSPEVSINLFRIFQETLTNIARHACAGRVEVLFRAEGRRLRLIVRDDGRGIDPEEIRARRTLGLLGMKERAYSIGGHLEVRSQPGQGTTIKVAVVLKK
ncbi:MAG: PAS domain S-box protein, partial [Bacteroidetes bacterium]|nr:PAS domain S-box protein [Bacteroidota bacterium]